jgi:hypothetical protein
MLRLVEPVDAFPVVGVTEEPPTLRGIVRLEVPLDA